jgi:hypothetical protein
MELKISSLVVGQRVSIARYGSWNVTSQGVYVVAKTNKLKAILRREHDGYERVFSVKRGLELKQYASTGDKYEDRNTFIETVEAMEARKVKLRKEQDIRALWQDAEKAAQSKNLKDLMQVVKMIEEFK